MSPGRSEMWLILEELLERLILEDILGKLLLEGEGEPYERMVGPCQGRKPLDGRKGGYHQLPQ